MSGRDPGASPGGATKTKRPPTEGTDVNDTITTHIGVRNADQVRRTLHLGIMSASSEQERAALRCALNLLNGAEPFEIDPVTGVAWTVAGFERITPGWVDAYARYDARDAAEFDWFRHKVMLDGRAVQAEYAAVHPHLAEPVWFPGHGPRTCVFCLVDANRAAGLPIETGMDPGSGGVLKAGA